MRNSTVWVAMISWFVFLFLASQLEALILPSSMSPCRLPSLELHANGISVCSVESVKNLRPVISGCNLYRSATLDDLTEEDAEKLLSGSAFQTEKPLAMVIDLRNADEIRKGKKVRTQGSQLFYDSPNVEFLTLPVLEDVDAFWDEAIATMDAGERWKATLQTAFVGGALDRAAARHLEKGGLPLLYALMMKTGGRPLALALEACLRVSSTDSGSVIFHCQKGKDRTGVLAMLLQTCLQKVNDDTAIVDAYALSGELIGELPNQSKESDDASSSTSTIDWSYFRGSPAKAMEETLSWTREQYGSVEGYLDAISFGKEKRENLRRTYED